MSTATATQNDDLIILSDNISPTFGAEPVISQDFNPTDNNSIISFDTPIDTANNNQIIDFSTKADNTMLWDNIIKQEEISLVWMPTTNEEIKVENLVSEVPKVEQEEIKELDSSINNLFWDLNFSNKTTTV